MKKKKKIYLTKNKKLLFDKVKADINPSDLVQKDEKKIKKS